MKKEKKDKHFIKKPTYKGGPEAMSRFIKSKLRYPAEALKKRVEGTVVVRIEIDHKGKVLNSEVISGVGAGCDEEACRVCNLLKFEVPRQRNVRVRFHKKINVHFRLPTKKGLKIQYNYVKSKESGKEGYSYTVGN